MGDKLNREEYFVPAAVPFNNNYNNVTGSADSASGGSGGSGMECMQVRSTPGPFNYLISEQAKSLVALQELQNEVGALLEFRDLVIETFPNLRCKMAPSTPAAARREWEPGVRVRRKLAAPGDAARTKPQPSVQDSGFSTETSCKDANSSAAAPRSRPAEDELWALLDVIQRKGVRLREEAESLRGELEARGEGGEGDGHAAEDTFVRALDQACGCDEARRLRNERDTLLARAAELEVAALSRPRLPVSPHSPAPPTPLGRLDRVLDTPTRTRVRTPDATKIAAILHETNPVELQRQLLTATVHTQMLTEKLLRAAALRISLKEQLERSRDENDDLKFQLEEKTIELEGTLAQVRQRERGNKTVETAPTSRSRECERSRSRSHSSMRDMEPVTFPGEAEAEAEARISETPRRRPSRIPLHTAAARARRDSGGGASPARPASAASGARYRAAAPAPPAPPAPAGKKPCAPRRPPAPDTKVRPRSFWNAWFSFKDSATS